VRYYNDLPVLPFGPNVILDSGASDHMTSNRALLTDIREHFVNVMMPDGFIVECVEKGTMRLSLEDPESGETYILPLLDTLLVPGIHSQLVSIPALNQSGIVAQFNASAAELFVNGNRIVINDPYHRRISDAGLPFVAHTEQETTPPTEAIPATTQACVPQSHPQLKRQYLPLSVSN